MLAPLESASESAAAFVVEYMVFVDDTGRGDTVEEVESELR